MLGWWAHAVVETSLTVLSFSGKKIQVEVIKQCNLRPSTFILLKWKGIDCVLKYNSLRFLKVGKFLYLVLGAGMKLYDLKLAKSAMYSCI